MLLNPKPIDEHRTKSPLRRALSGWAGRLGFAYYDMLYAQTDLTQPIHLARSRVEVESATDRDRETIAAGLPEVPKYWFDRAIEAGSVCYVARREGQIAGYTFANPRVILMLEDELEILPEGFAFFHNGYIFPEFRGRGLYPIVMGQFYTLLRSQGIRYVAGLVDRKNRPALGAGQHFAIRRESAPILYLPGLKPIVLGKGFRMMREVAKERPRG